MSKTRASCFITDSRHLETIKALGLRPRAFICFTVSGTPDETLALVFDILHEQPHIESPNFGPRVVNTRPWRHYPNMGSYLHPNNANFRGLRRIWEFLPTLRGVIILPPSQPRFLARLPPWQQILWSSWPACLPRYIRISSRGRSHRARKLVKKKQFQLTERIFLC